MANFGGHLRQLRKERGLTQSQVAAMAGVTQGTVSNWEVGCLEMSGSHAEAMAGALRVPVSYLRERRCDEVAAPLKLTGVVRRRLPPALELPRYPVKGGLDQMLALGPVAVEAYERARQKHGLDVIAAVVDRFPRDTATELLGHFQLLAEGAVLRRTTLSSLNFPLVSIDGPLTFQNAHGAVREVLVLERSDAFLIGIPQVWVPLPRSNRSCRADLFVIYSRGSRSMLADVEYDGTQHSDFAQLDAERAALLGVPRLGYPNARVRQPGFIGTLVDDLRHHLKRTRKS